MSSDAARVEPDVNHAHAAPRLPPVSKGIDSANAEGADSWNSPARFEVGRDTEQSPLDAQFPAQMGEEEVDDAGDRVIMVVDDDHAIREALKDLLSLLGFHVVSARDGEDALALLGNGCKPFAILLDLGMPRMDGWRFRNELLCDPRYAGLRVIVITASQNQHAETLGVKDVLTKPIPLQRLVEVLGTEEHEG